MGIYVIIMNIIFLYHQVKHLFEDEEGEGSPKKATTIIAINWSILLL